MRSFATTVCALLCCMMPFVLQAQNTWVWGRGNTCTGMDGWPVAADHMGNVYMAGINFGGMPAVFGTTRVPCLGNGTYQTIIAKYDGDGNFQWASGTQYGSTYLMGITTDYSDNALLFGSFSSPTVQIGNFILTKNTAMDNQYFIAKYDPSGHVLWAITDGNAQGNYVLAGNIAFILGTGAIASDPFGYIYIAVNFHEPAITIAGNTITNADPTGKTDDILVVKYDQGGNFIWAKSFGSDSASDDAYGLTVTPAGDIYIAGTYASRSLSFGSTVLGNTTGKSLAYIARLDYYGNPTWACGSGGTGLEYAAGLASDDFNNVYLTGGVKDNAISFSGVTLSNPAPDHPVMYLVKFDPNNQVSWDKTVADISSPGAWGYAIAMSQCGTVWVTGVMSNTLVVDGHQLPSPPNSCDPVFIAGFTKSGAYAGSAALQSGGDDQTGIACDYDGNVYLCSDFACIPFVIAKDTFKTTYEDDTTNNCYGGGELIYVAKYASQAVDSQKVKVSKMVLCPGISFSLEAPTGYLNYVWNDGSVGSSFKISDTGTFWVYSSLDCKRSEIDTFKVGYECECDKAFFLPNSFTPNGDGQNDVFYPRSGKGVKEIRSFRIYNRWGELLFERDNFSSNDANNAWDGSYKGESPLPDVYVWVAEIICDNNTVLNKKGSVTIIR